MDMLKWFIKPIMFFRVEHFIVFIIQLLFVLAPNRNHTVYGLFFAIMFIFLFTALFQPTLRHVHFDGISYEIGVLFNYRLQSVLIQVLVIFLLFSIGLNSQNNVSAYSILGPRLQGIAIGSLRL